MYIVSVRKTSLTLLSASPQYLYPTNPIFFFTSLSLWLKFHQIMICLNQNLLVLEENYSNVSHPRAVCCDPVRTQAWEPRKSQSNPAPSQVFSLSRHHHKPILQATHLVAILDRRSKVSSSPADPVHSSPTYIQASTLLFSATVTTLI